MSKIEIYKTLKVNDVTEDSLDLIEDYLNKHNIWNARSISKNCLYMHIFPLNEENVDKFTSFLIENNIVGGLILGTLKKNNIEEILFMGIVDL